MHKVKIKTDTLNETGLQDWDFAMDHIAQYLVGGADSVPAEIRLGPNGVEIIVWSDQPQSYFKDLWKRAKA